MRGKILHQMFASDMEEIVVFLSTFVSLDIECICCRRNNDERDSCGPEFVSSSNLRWIESVIGTIIMMMYVNCLLVN